MIKLTGELVAVEWDRNEEPLEVCVETEDDRYLVSHTEHYEELLSYVGQEIEIEGELDEDIDGEPTIEVHAFQLLASLDDIEEEEEEDSDEFSEEDDLLDEEW